MKVEVCGSKLGMLLAFFLITGWSFSQTILSGEITFERRTNLEKRYEGSQMMGGRSAKWMKEPKVDEFKLYFDENGSLFLPIQKVMADDDREWATMKNTTYQDFNENKIEREFNMMGTSFFFRDTLKNRDWIVTGNTRDIAGYKTRQVMWEANDSTRIYAWFAEQIVPAVGPESYNDLPGAILGLAIEDGGVVYFAKEVKPLSTANFREKRPKMRPRNTYEGEEQLKEFLSKSMEGRMGGGTGRMSDDFFIW